MVISRVGPKPPPERHTAFGLEETVAWAHHIVRESGASTLQIVWTHPELPPRIDVDPPDLVPVTWTVAGIYRTRRRARRAAQNPAGIERSGRGWVIAASARSARPDIAVCTAVGLLLRRLTIVEAVDTMGDELADPVPTPLTALSLLCRRP